MILGSITYHNINGDKLKTIIKSVINDKSVNTTLDDILAKYVIGSVDREDIEYVVNTLGTRTFVSAGNDLTPIIDYIEKLCWEANELINKQNLLHVLKQQLPDTNLFNGLDLTLTESELLAQKQALIDAAMAKITQLVMDSNLSSILPEVIDPLITGINNTLGLNYGLDAVKVGLGEKTDQEINESNLRYAIVDTLCTGDFFATKKWSLVLFDAWDNAIALHGKAMLTDEQVSNLKFDFISKVIDSNGDNKFVDYGVVPLTDKYEETLIGSVAYFSYQPLVFDTWIINIVETIIGLALEVDLELFYSGDVLRNDDDTFTFENILSQAFADEGINELTEEEILALLKRFFELLGIDGYLIKYNLDIILSNILSKLDMLNLSASKVGSEYIIDLTPMEYNLGSTLVEPTNISLVLNEEDKENYIVKLDDNAISLNSKVVMQQVNATDTNIKANIIKPQFRVSVFGGAAIEFNENDAYKVLTNDGKNFKWEYIETFFKEGVGLLKSVDTLADRDSIPERYLSVGMIVYVKSTGVYYTLLSTDPIFWDVFKKNDLSKVSTTRPIVYNNVKLGHGDTGTDLKIDKIKTLVIDTNGETLPFQNYLMGIEPNLVSFKNVGFTQAMLYIDDGSIIVNPNSVYETPYDFTMDIKLKGKFNYVGAYITFEQLSEEAITACEMSKSGDLPISIVSPYF